MRTLRLILEEAGRFRPGFHIHIENPPWMPLDIEDVGTRGPIGFRAISVAHYGQQNGDAMRDPEMLFEMELRGGVYVFTPYYWRNDYLGMEQYSSYRDDEGNFLVMPNLQRRQRELAQLWDDNLQWQGYVNAFRRSRLVN